MFNWIKKLFKKKKKPKEETDPYKVTKISDIDDGYTHRPEHDPPM